MIIYYKEDNGDYLAIDNQLKDCSSNFSGRATAIANQVTSVCTTGISIEFLKENCKKIGKNKVPKEWLKAIGL